MNRKIFIPLLIVPCIAFSFNMIHPVSFKSEPVCIDSGTEAMSCAHENAMTQSTVVLTKHHDDKLAKIEKLKSELEKEMESYDKYKSWEISEAYARKWDDVYSESLYEVVEDKLIDAFVEHKLFGVNNTESFSRCPSGYHVRMAMVNPPSELQHINGQILLYNGCRAELKAKFRISQLTEDIEILISKKIGYVSIEKWIEVAQFENS